LHEALDALIAAGSELRYDLVGDNVTTILHGGGEYELEVAIMRLMRDFQIELEIGAPNVAYRETITKTIEHGYTHKKQTDGSGAFAKVIMRFEALAPGAGCVFANEAAGDTVPPDCVTGVENGLKLAMQSGVIAGFPMIDFKATLIDGQHHDVDSNATTFEIAARNCFQEAIPKAGPKLLEPMMRIEVVTPKEYIGDVIGDLLSRRCPVQGLDSRGDTEAIAATGPLANMFGYVNTLQSMTQGRATYKMHFDHYGRTPHTRG